MTTILSRKKTAAAMIKYLEETVYCKNVMKLAEESAATDDYPINKLLVNNILVSFKIINYNDDIEYINKNDSELQDESQVNNLFKSFDFMTKANYTDNDNGLENFPYIYGVLNCHNKEHSKIYVYYESYDTNLVDLIINIEHPSQWYDIVFQIIMIDNYISVVNKYTYINESLKNYLCKKPIKPFYKKYTINDQEISVNHHNIIMLWNLKDFVPTNAEPRMNGVEILLKFLDNASAIKIPPSDRIKKMLKEVQSNPSNTELTLTKYYSQPPK